LFEDVVELHPAGRIARGESFHKELNVPIPNTGAFSFDGGDNEIEWTAEARIDMPWFPDWKERRTLQVVPTSFLTPETSSPAPNSSAAPPPRSAVPRAAGPALPNVTTLLQEITKTGRFGSDRHKIVDAAKGRVLGVVVTVEATRTAIGSPIGDGYNTGMVVTGVVSGSGETVAIHTKDASKAHVANLRRGDEWQTPASVHSWDALYNRLVLAQVDG